MVKLKLKSKPEFELVTAVAADYGNPVEELFAEAAIGEISIFVSLDKEQACLVYSDKPLKKHQPISAGNIEIEENWTSSSDEQLSVDEAVEIEALLNKNRVQDRKGKKTKFTKYTLFGMQKIDSDVFVKAKKESFTTKIKLDSTYSLAFDAFFDLLLIRNPSINLKESLDANMLYILKSDVEKMKYKDTSAKKKPATRRIGHRKPTLICREKYQKIADEYFSDYPHETIVHAAEFIIETISNSKDRELKKCTRDHSTIRQNIIKK